MPVPDSNFVQPNRLADGGRVGRVGGGRGLMMRFDGGGIAGVEGDTVASALLANGVSVVGRSFKYHRARGVFSAGPEEPGALGRVDAGGRATPNVPLTMIPARDGLQVESQNRWPSLQWDVGAVNQLFSPFVAAGFYYKTFVGWRNDTRFWMLCERFIRRAAGLGRAADSPDPDSYEKVNGFCDVLVVGAGAAGLCAALAAARAGARVVVAEQHPECGGALKANRAGSESDSFVANTLAELQSFPKVQVLAQTVAFGAYDNEVFGLIERVVDESENRNGSDPRNRNGSGNGSGSDPRNRIGSDSQLQNRNGSGSDSQNGSDSGSDSRQLNQCPKPSNPVPGLPRLRFHLLRAKAAVLASGAIERPPVFGGNDLPGVMLADAARTYANHFAVLPGRRAIVFANNDRAYAVAADLARVGAEVKMIDPRSAPNPDVVSLAESAGAEVLSGRAVLQARGFGKLRAAVVGKAESDNAGRVGGATETIPCDLLAVGAGWSPAIHLRSQRGARPLYDAKRFAFFANDSVAPNIVPAGLCAGAGSLGEVVADGFAAGIKAAMLAGKNKSAGQAPEVSGNAGDSLNGFSPPMFASDNWGDARGKAFVDSQNDATVSDLRLAAREGYDSPEHLKRYTTIGMGTEQGKTANDNALFLLAAETGRTTGEMSPTTFRPPYSGMEVGALAGRNVGKRFRPFRLSPAHSAHLDAGAKFIDAGLWLRPRFYPQGGEDVFAASVREAAHVRAKVGMTDVSTLGKIAVQGPDAAEFLNRVYANRWDNLKVGRARYGAMLREDGMVFDDGVTARLAEDDFLMTTTTANAGAVLSHLEKLLQTRWTKLRAQVATTTDRWAAVAVAGPLSREVVGAAFPGADVSDEGLPHMGFVFAELRTNGAKVKARIQRVSFSGERAYEVYVPADFGIALWSALSEAGKEFGAVAYGSEALGILRIEKGHPAGAELDGRTTLRDLRLDRMAKKDGGFIGAALRKRSALEDESRPVLVGFVSVNPREEIKAGSLPHSAGSGAGGLGDGGEGWISSAAWSPELGGYVALGFLRDGARREGEVLCCANPLGGVEVRARVSRPCMVDAEGGRMAD